MSGYNSLTILGYAGKDSDMSYSNEGKAVTRFSIAVSEYAGKDKQGKPVYNSQWFNVSAFGTLAETANKFVQKGGMYLIRGRLVVSKYVDRNGQNAVNLNVIADMITPVQKANEALSTSGQYGNSNETIIDLSL